MSAQETTKHLLRFGAFLLDPAERQLMCAGKVVPLTPKTFDTLVVLAEASGRLVTKDELLKRLWPDTFVEEATLAHNISDLRKALKEADAGGKYIETVPKSGYRFVAEVVNIRDEAFDLVIKKSRQARLVITEETIIEDEPNDIQPSHGSALTLGRKAAWKTRATFFSAGLVLFALATLAIFRSGSKSAQPTTELNPKSLAVLPFKPLAADTADEYLGLGITDSLITKLSNVRQIIVRPTSAVQKYAIREFDPLIVGKEQQVEAVLEGSLQKLGDKVRVTVRLLATKDGASLWAYQCDEYCTDIFTMQDAVSQQVAMALLTELSGNEQQLLVKRETMSAEAYQLYLKGRYFWNRRNVEGLKKSINYFEQAIALDPHYGRAFAGLSDSYLLLWGYGVMPPDQAVPQARTAALQALEQDGTLAEAHLSLGAIAWNYDWDWASAEREFRRAIELNPHYATAHHYLGEFLTYQGRFNEGWREIERALEIDPTSLIINTDAGLILYFSRRPTQAIAQYRKALELDPGFWKAHHGLAVLYLQEKMFAEAQAEIDKLKPFDDSPGHCLTHELMGDLYALSGHKAEAQKAFAEVRRLATRGYVDPGKLMWIHINLGEKDQAFVWMEKTYGQRSVQLTSIKVNPGFDLLRSDPRFQDLLRRMHLAE